MKTLYEILEVSENASKEIIEKAYKVLAKKYHPDLQTEQNKANADKKMKEINEAYSILGDEEKKREYDNKLAKQREYDNKLAKQREEQEASKTQYNQNNIKTKSTYQNQEQTYYTTQNPTYSSQQRPMTEAEYQEVYERYLRNLGYKIKYKWTWKRFRDLLITILIIVAICFILWFFPPTHKLMMDFYNSNSILKTIIDVIGGIFKGIWNTICSIFSGKKTL